MRYVFLLLVLVVSSAFVFGTDDSFKPYLHKASVPNSPKLTMYGQYQTNLYPGSATYTYSISVPKGVNGLAPLVSLSYNSQGYRGRSVLGSGWSLSKDYIYRDTKGTLDDASDDVFILVLDGNTYELVYSGGSYHTEVDYYFKISFSSDYFEITKPNGVKYRFGYNSDSKVASNSGRSYSLSWYLDLVTDTHGNTISYSYSQNPNSEDSGTAYLSSISYGLNQLQFSYEDSVRPDRRRGYEFGNLIEESRRLSDITVYSSGNIVSRNHVSYTTLNPSLSSVFAISYYGSDSTSLLYTISFDYYQSQSGYSNSTNYIPPAIFSDNSHNDYGVRLEDVNNDGHMDILLSNSTDKKVWLNNKNNNWTLTSQFSIPENFTVSNVDKGVRFADINQDGLIDLLVSRPSYNKVYTNNGTSWSYDSSWNIPVNFTDASGYDSGVQITDINGDGKIDFIYSRAGQNSTYLGTTSGWTQSTFIIPYNFIDASNKDTGARLIDVNGDGLPDIVIGTSTLHETWLNTGSGFLNSTSTWAPPVNFITSTNTDNGIRFDDVNLDGLVDILEDFNGTNISARLNTGFGWQSNITWKSPEAFTKDGYNVGRRLADVNGDGLSDLIVSHQDNSQKYTWVRNSTLPYLLKSITNAYGGRTFINYTTSTQYNNTVNGVSQIGFNIFVVSNVVNNNSMTDNFSAFGLTNYSYAFGKYNYPKQEFRGFGLSIEKTPYSSINHYFYQDSPRRGKEQKTEIYSVNGSLYSANVKDYNWTISSNIYNVSLLYSTDFLYDGFSNPVIHNVTYSYSHFGLPGQVIDWGDSSISGDEKIINYTYTFNYDSWIVNKLSSETLFDSNGVKVKETKYYYDNLGLNGVGSKGELTKTESWNSNGQNVFTYYAYDDLGNVISVTDPLAHITKYSYDSSNVYPATEINALGHVKKYSYDDSTGNLLWSESNGIRTSFEYDIFGRILREIQPYDSSSLPTKSYSYSSYGTTPVSVTVNLKTTANNTDDVIYFYDGFGNLLQIKSVFENNQDIVKNIFYDGFGNVISEQNPYFDTHSANISSVSLTANKTFYSYDSMSRVYFVLNPDGTNKTVSFDRYNITDYDENGHKHKYELNAFGQIIKVHEYNNYPVFDEYVTSYSYDLLGNLIKIVDTKGNVFSFTFDSLSRKTAMSDPDLGNWSYSYDLAGNLISQTDARRNTTTLTYDAINRIVSKNSANVNISFNYDLQYYGSLSNVTQTTTNRTDLVFTYDDRYRIDTQSKKLNQKSVSLTFSYDSQNKILSKNVPTLLTYNYNHLGKVQSVSGILNSSNYNALGQLANRTYANGLVQTFLYDSQNARLRNIYIPNIENMSYSYDNVGNILLITDTIQNRISTMQYDALDRLISANVGMDKYRYVFSPIGNIQKIVKNNSTTLMSYNGRPAHAPVIVTDSLPNSVDLYEPHDLDTQLLNRTTEMVIRNSNNVSMNSTLSMNFGAGTINTNLGISANESVFFFIQSNYSNGGSYRINVTVNGTDRQGFGLKFGTYAKSLNLLNKDISITTFELLVGNSLNQTIRNVTWNCSNGISSFFAQDITGLQSLFDIMQYNYSSSGVKTFTCNISSLDGSDSISVTFSIDSLKLENYNIMYQNLSRRVVSFDLMNYFYPVTFNLSLNTSSGNISKKQLSLSSNERMFAFVEANYSDDILYSVGINVSNSETYDTYNDYFTFDGVDIKNYARFDGNYTNKVLTFQVVNNWNPQNVTWNLNNPNISRTQFLNTSDSVFVFVENNYTLSGLTPLRATANVSLFSDSFIDLFDNHPLELSKFDAVGTNVFEMFAVNHLNKLQNISWSIGNIVSNDATSINNSIFIFVQTNYTSGVNIANAMINSTSYNDTEKEVVVI